MGTLRDPNVHFCEVKVALSHSLSSAPSAPTGPGSPKDRNGGSNRTGEATKETARDFIFILKSSPRLNGSVRGFPVLQFIGVFVIRKRRSCVRVCKFDHRSLQPGLIGEPKCAVGSAKSGAQKARTL